MIEILADIIDELTPIAAVTAFEKAGLVEGAVCMSAAGWQVLSAAVVILDVRSRLVGAILHAHGGKFAAHSVDGKIGLFDTPAEAVKALRAESRNGKA